MIADAARSLLPVVGKWPLLFQVCKRKRELSLSNMIEWFLLSDRRTKSGMASYCYLWQAVKRGKCSRTFFLRCFLVILIWCLMRCGVFEWTWTRQFIIFFSSWLISSGVNKNETKTATWRTRKLGTFLGLFVPSSCSDCSKCNSNSSSKWTGAWKEEAVLVVSSPHFNAQMALSAKSWPMVVRCSNDRWHLEHHSHFKSISNPHTCTSAWIF